MKEMEKKNYVAAFRGLFVLWGNLHNYPESGSITARDGSEVVLMKLLLSVQAPWPLFHVMGTGMRQGLCFWIRMG